MGIQPLETSLNCTSCNCNRRAGLRNSSGCYSDQPRCGETIPATGVSPWDGTAIESSPGGTAQLTSCEELCRPYRTGRFFAKRSHGLSPVAGIVSPLRGLL